jgi:hypothetical protein
MRIVQLSDHPGDMLRHERRGRAELDQREQARYQQARASHLDRVSQARRARDQARAQHRWLAWLRGLLAVRRELRHAPPPPATIRAASDREESLTAGAYGEQLVATELGRVLGDEWTLLRGYHNRRGEIDHLLLGPAGLLAIESKYLNATISCNGDRWWYVKYDNYGNQVRRDELTDRTGRSPSEQVSQPAGQLADFLRSRGHAVTIECIVLFTHPKSRLATCTRPTVRIATSTSQVIRLLKASGPVLSREERAELEPLIIRDHQYHRGRRR